MHADHAPDTTGPAHARARVAAGVAACLALGVAAYLLTPVSVYGTGVQALVGAIVAFSAGTGWATHRLLTPRVGAVTAWVALTTAWALTAAVLTVTTGTCGAGDAPCTAAGAASWAVAGATWALLQVTCIALAVLSVRSVRLAKRLLHGREHGTDTPTPARVRTRAHRAAARSGNPARRAGNEPEGRP